MIKSMAEWLSDKLDRQTLINESAYLTVDNGPNQSQKGWVIFSP